MAKNYEGQETDIVIPEKQVSEIKILLMEIEKIFQIINFKIKKFQMDRVQRRTDEGTLLETTKFKDVGVPKADRSRIRIKLATDFPKITLDAR